MDPSPVKFADVACPPVVVIDFVAGHAIRPGRTYPTIKAVAS
jgi:hypothetical protein